ncbi:metal ABC transporter ATP-binding protein [Leucobacter sp. CSA2]|uniref:Metal ABC transporter ATP-binding protein n=1 Tax=Leucobacter edaphi TaxID=2796472 RepID=A0A934Q9F3_9MICO|nr:metal ABC transporter ATP-binding protein [Leucobacter edaphi]
MNGPAIEAHGVTVRYGEVVALDCATLTVERGRVCGLVGTNGAGKSTLFKAIMGSVKLSGGTVRIDGMDPVRARRAGEVSYVPQSEDVDWAFPLTVREVIMTGRYGRMGVTRRAAAADHAAVDLAIDRTELGELQGRQIGELSGGQRKRVFVARGLAQEAAILLLDEPFAGVDKRSEATISRVLREHASGGGTVLVSTHDLAALVALADEAALMARRILVHGTPEEVLRPEHLTRAFGLDPLARTAEGVAA